MYNTAEKLPNESNLLTHNADVCDSKLVYETVKQRLIATGDSHLGKLDEKISLLDELIQFPLGSFLLINKGLNAYWSDYINSDQTSRSFTNKLEEFFLTKAPSVVAKRYCFQSTKQLLQNNLFDGITIASMPCGAMGDILNLDYSNIKRLDITGIDLDIDALQLACSKSLEQKLDTVSLFIKADLIEDNFKDSKFLQNRFHLAVANGLGVYITDNNKLLKMYQNCSAVIKSGGLLITNFLTPSPLQNTNSPWDISKINDEDLRIENIVLKEIIQGGWNNQRNVDEMVEILNQAGFNNIEILFDPAKMHPIAIAQKA